MSGDCPNRAAPAATTTSRITSAAAALRWLNDNWAARHRLANARIPMNVVATWMGDKYLPTGVVTSTNASPASCIRT
jgi:hypothetical protein